MKLKLALIFSFLSTYGYGATIPIEDVLTTKSTGFHHTLTVVANESECFSDPNPVMDVNHEEKVIDITFSSSAFLPCFEKNTEPYLHFELEDLMIGDYLIKVHSLDGTIYQKIVNFSGQNSLDFSYNLFP